MDKKTLIALFLILIVFWISSEFIWKPNQERKVQELKNQQVTQIDEQKPSKQIQNITSPQINEIHSETSETNIDINDFMTLENEKIKLVFSNKGAVINSVKLKGFYLEDKENFVELIPNENVLLNLKLTDSFESIINLKNTVFEHSQTANTISFFTTINNRTVKKIFTIGNEYNLEMEIQIDNFNEISGYELAFDSGIADTEKYLKMKSNDYQMVYQIANVQDEIKLRKLKEEQKISGKVNWAAIKSKYFTMAIIPNDLIDTRKLIAFKNNESPAINMFIAHNKYSLNHHFKIYFGPLDYNNLVAYENGLENVVELGWKPLQWIGKIFKQFLNFLNGFIPSWGVCIIIFAIILKMLLYPLTHKSFESTTKMQKVQPLIKEIQAKYKGDAQTMNAEMKKLYKEHGVNPLGGCLPMLLQMPVIFALYPILRYSISLRQASFMWLPDLSEPDPKWALPILMAVFMFVQQKLMAPSKATMDGMDEKAKAAQQSQKMMMYMMPIMMFFIFKGLSSGLVLYWTVFSVIGSIQQYFIKKKFN